MIKKFIAVAAFAFAFAFAFSASAAWDFGSATVKKGSTGMYASNVQTALNTCNNAGLVVDGNFGTMSANAAKAFQASKGLTADGYVGNMTKAALNSCSTMPTPSMSLCPNGMTLASNCTMSPSGTQTNNSGAPLSINSVSSVSGYLNTSVGVGTVDKQIANARLVTGAGGAGNLTGLNLSFYNTGTSSDYQFTKYAQSVSIWLNGTKVGTLPASQFSQYNSVFSAFVPVSGAILNANSTNNIVIGVTALPVIDSQYLSSGSYPATWMVDATSIRYSDSTGVFTYTPSALFSSASGITSFTTVNANTYFKFASAASAQSIKLTVTKNLGDSNDSVVVGSSSANTNGVVLAKIDLNAQGDTINLRRFPVTLATASGTANQLYSIVNTLRLYDANGTQLDSQSVVSGAGAQTVTFQNLNVNVPVNTTQTFTVKGDFNSVSSFTAGDGVSVSVSSTNVNNGLQAYDSGNNTLSGSTVLTGSTSGNVVSMYVNGVNVTTWGTPTINVAAAGGAQTHSTVTYTIPFAVTAFGAVAYIPSTAGLAATALATNKIQYCVDATTACSAATGPTGVIVYAGSDTYSANTTNGNFQIPIGQTKNFNLIITYQPASAISTRASLVNVNWATTDIQGASGWSTYTSGLSANAYKTPYAAAQ